MRNKKVMIALLAVIVLAFGGGISSFAANPLVGQSTATVYFYEFDDWDDLQVTRPGPHHDPRTPISRGPFVLAWVPTFDFNPNFTDEHVMGSFPIVGGVVRFDVLSERLPATVAVPNPPLGPNPVNNFHFVNVWDYRNFVTGTGSNGWTVTARMIQQFTAGSDVLTGARIRLQRVTPAGSITGFSLDGTTHMGSTVAPIDTVNTGLPVLYTGGNRFLYMATSPAGPGSPVRIASSAATTGMGSTAINLGFGPDIELEVPNASIQVGDFVAEIEWTLTAGPNWITP